MIECAPMIMAVFPLMFLAETRPRPLHRRLSRGLAWTQFAACPLFSIDLLFHPLVDVDESLRTGRALELRRPLLPLRVEADLQRVPADLVDAQHHRPLAQALVPTWITSSPFLTVNLSPSKVTVIPLKSAA